MTPLQRRITGLLRSEPMTLQQIIDAFKPLGIKWSDVTRAIYGLHSEGDVLASPQILDKPEKVMLVLAPTL